jgi:molecular chaperone DnaK (HSP70)
VTSPLAVGIDLGTTHTALAFRPLDGAGASEIFEVPQLVAPGEVRGRPLLPSFLYLPHPAELPPGALALPWRPDAADAVGELARALGAKTPLRLVSSAKSWLSHPQLDRRAATLPAGAPEEMPRVSPLEASARTLAHLREAWDHAAGGDPARALAAQRIVLTVPASFDAVARQLTVEAAVRAGLPEPTLLEEPQAALYAWVDGMGDRWRKEVRPGDVILVVDVGGGTTDLSLVAVRDEGGDLGLERLAVGDHVLLGGDNVDLALGHALAEKLAAAGKKPDRAQLLALAFAARDAKEALFASPRKASLPVAVAGRGTSLVGGALRTELTREELVRIAVEGFFPRVPADAAPVQARRTGLTALGLPYAADPAVTRHLAAFLARHPTPPTALLVNGGVMKATPIVERVLEVLAGWAAAAGRPAPRLLPGADPDLAVARGAAAYARVRAGHGIRIRGGTARAYYVGIEAAVPAVPGLAPPLRAVCLAPAGMEEGTSAELPGEEVGLVVGEPVAFPLFASSSRQDAVGAEAPDPDALDALPPVEATLPAEGRAPGEVVPVRLTAHVTEIGTLELAARDREGHAWRLEWNLRASSSGSTSAP